MTCRTLEEYYHVNANTFENSTRTTSAASVVGNSSGHVYLWIIFSENIGSSICIDETALSNGELYTIVINRSCCGGKATIIWGYKGYLSGIVDFLFRNFVKWLIPLFLSYSVLKFHHWD